MGLDARSDRVGDVLQGCRVSVDRGDEDSFGRCMDKAVGIDDEGFVLTGFGKDIAEQGRVRRPDLPMQMG